MCLLLSLETKSAHSRSPDGKSHRQFGTIFYHRIASGGAGCYSETERCRYAAFFALALALYLGIAVIHWWWPFAVDLFHTSELFILTNTLVDSAARWRRWWGALWRWLQQQCETFSILICLNHAQIHTDTLKFLCMKSGKKEESLWEMWKRAKGSEREKRV